MPKKTDYKKKPVIQPIDCFYETDYTSHTATGIQTLYNDLRFRIACKLCKINNVDIKMEVNDTYLPTFVIMRKFYCIDF